MGQSANETVIQQFLADLGNDSAKRRWSTLQKIAQSGIVDVRILDKVEKLSSFDPVDYVRQEAVTLLTAPGYQNLLRERRQIQMSEQPTTPSNEPQGNPPNNVLPDAQPAPVTNLPAVSAATASTARPTRSAEERRAVLDSAIENFVKQGYRVMSRTDTTAQMVKPKSFSCAIAMVCLLLAVVVGLGIILLIGYVIIYAAQKDETIYLTVNEYGEISTTR